MSNKKPKVKTEPYDSQIHIKRIERMTTQVRFFISVGICIFGIFASILIALIVSWPDPPSKEDIKIYGSRYDPIFRRVLLDKAYAILSDVHITEIRNQAELINNIKEIKNSLEMVGAFDNRNKGLLKIFDLILALSYGNDCIVEQDFLFIDPLRDNSLNMNPQEASFFLTFQGLLYLKNMRNEKDLYKYDQYLNNAKAKFISAQRINPGISNMWNGLGICLLEEAHNNQKLALVPEARDCFKLAYELHRSTINLAAEINNIYYANMVMIFYNSFKIVVVEEKSFFYITFDDKSKIKEMMIFLNEALQSFEKALMYEPNAISTLLSKAECLCNLALCQKALDLSSGKEIKFNDKNINLEQAMEIIRQANLKGFSNWPYLFSRVWIANTLLRIEKYREELLSFLEP